MVASVVVPVILYRPAKGIRTTTQTGVCTRNYACNKWGSNTLHSRKCGGGREPPRRERRVWEMPDFQLGQATFLLFAGPSYIGVADLMVRSRPSFCGINLHMRPNATQEGRAPKVWVKPWCTANWQCVPGTRENTGPNTSLGTAPFSRSSSVASEI